VAAQNHISSLEKCYSKGKLEKRNCHCSSPCLWVPATTAITLGSLKALLLGFERGPLERQSQKGTDHLALPLCESVCEQVSICALGWLARENRWSQLFRLVHECACVASQQHLSQGIPPTTEYHFPPSVPHSLSAQGTAGLLSMQVMKCRAEGWVLAAAATDAHVVQASSADFQPPTGLCASSTQFAS